MTDLAESSKKNTARRSEAFFGRRKAQNLSLRQSGLVENLLPELLVNLQTQAPHDLACIFQNRPGHIILEIGFGAGEHLIHQAISNPDTGFIGVEPFVNSMAKALVAISESKMQNIRLYNEDATEILDWLPAGSLDRIDLLYPDPWPKKRHWKRRFVNRKNLNRMARVLKPGGFFHFASDIDTYINWTLNHCYRHPGFVWLANSAGSWCDPYENWIRTRYEAKAIRENRRPCYLRFQKPCA